MSELNVYHHELRPDEYDEFYLKYEADKVIADLEKKLDLYKRGFKEDDKINAYLYAEVRHSNYKRCLAMAKWCEAELFAYPPFGTESPKEKWWQKWHKRWLELAEKLKDE